MQNVTQFVTAVGTDIKALQAQDIAHHAKISALEQKDIELSAKVATLEQETQAYKEATEIKDSTTETKMTWSSQKIAQALNQAKQEVKQELVGGASSALDTFAELATALDNDASFAAKTATTLAGKLSINDSQSLSSEQKRQVWTNLGLGDMSIDLLAIYNGAKA